jgi:Tfp pilus assembly PilM family ATPase
MVDILIPNKIDFGYICPEIVLNTMAIQKYADCPANSMLVYMGENSSYLAYIGEWAGYFRSLLIAGTCRMKTITESQKVSFEKAKSLLLELCTNRENENCAFMAYYLKQFSHKLRQEIKRSELFYRRTLKQSPITKSCLTGKESHLYDTFNAPGNMEIINVFNIFKDKFRHQLHQEEVMLIENNIEVFVGAAYCL